MFALHGTSPPPVRKSPRKPQGREQSQIQLPPKKRAKTNELSAGNYFLSSFNSSINKVFSTAFRIF